MRRIKFAIYILIIFLSVPLILNAQRIRDRGLSDQFFPNFNADKDMQVVMNKRTPAKYSIQFGGWLTPTFITDYKTSSDTLTSSITTARLWLKAYLWQNSYIYIRIKDVFTGVIHQEGYDFDNIDNLFDLDAAFVNISDEDRNFEVILGRKYFTIGTGLVLNGRGDGIEVDYYSKYVSFKLFGMYSGLLQKDNNLYQLSSEDIASGSSRIFTGGTLSFMFENQIAYLLGMAQFDFNEEPSGVKEKYQSQYFGGGIKGILLDGLSYYGEFVYQIGKSYATGSSTYNKKDIRAMAGQFGLNYYFNALLNPVLIVNYAYGSGDKNRTSYYTSNLNDSAGNDTGFMSFGTYVGGYALRPVLGNIHIFRGGISLSPFSWSNKNFIKRFTLIAKYSYYLKSVVNGTINGGEASLNSRDIGHGVDVAIRWKIFGDFSFFVNYAIFLPGEAWVSTEPNRHFISEGFVISF